MLKQGIDTTTPAGRFTFHVLAAMDEMLADLISEGTREGLESAQARGRVGGRKPKLTDLTMLPPVFAIRQSASATVPVGLFNRGGQWRFGRQPMVPWASAASTRGRRPSGSSLSPSWAERDRPPSVTVIS